MKFSIKLNERQFDAVKGIMNMLNYANVMKEFERDTAWDSEGKATSKIAFQKTPDNGHELCLLIDVEASIKTLGAISNIVSSGKKIYGSLVTIRSMFSANRPDPLTRPEDDEKIC